jgi:arylsulfatase A-like enzyme
VLSKHLGDDPARIRRRPSDEDARLVVSQYDAEIERVDDLLSGFVDWLDEKGILDDTLVVVMSDHGDEFWDHGGVDHVHTLYDELLRVAWFMTGPGVEPGRVVERPVGWGRAASPR